MVKFYGIFNLKSSINSNDLIQKIKLHNFEFKEENFILSYDKNCIVYNDFNLNSEKFNNIYYYIFSNENYFILIKGEIYDLNMLWKEYNKSNKISTLPELIIYLYETYGINFILKINGNFLITLYDIKKCLLFLISDKLGSKPLYFHVDNEFLYFSSELSILSKLCNNNTLSEHSIYEYLIYGFISAPNTIFKNIEKLESATILTYDKTNHKLLKQKYWQPFYAPQHGKNINVFTIELLNELKIAIKERINNDLDIGASLSGGINSSIIVALMSKISSKKVKSFTLNFDEDESNDSKFALKISELFDCDHYTFNIKSNELELLPQIVYLLDEPLADLTLLPTFQTIKLISQYVPIIFTGDGADELFGGHKKYLYENLALVYLKIPKLLRKVFLEKIIKFFPITKNKFLENIFIKVKTFLDYIKFDPNYRFLSFSSYFSGEILRALVSNNLKNNCDIILKLEKRYEFEFNNNNFEDWLSTLLFCDLKYYLQNNLFLKNEKISSYFNVIVQTPFLDYKIIDLSMKIPINYKIRNFSLKHILKLAVNDILPSYILNRLKNQFIPSYDKWFKNNMIELLIRILLNKNSFVKDFLNPYVIKNIINFNNLQIKNFSHQIYNLLILEIWYQLHVKNKLTFNSINDITLKHMF